MPPKILVNSGRLVAALVARLRPSMRRVLEPTGTPWRALGVDVSTRCTGYAVVDSRGVVLECEAVSSARRPAKAPAAEAPARLLDTATAVSERLKAVCDAHAGALAAVGVEDFMRSFAAGRTSVAAMFQLARLNGIVAYECRRHSGLTPRFFTPGAARAKFGIRCGSGAGVGVGDDAAGGVEGGLPGAEGRGPEHTAPTVKDAVFEFVRLNVRGFSYERARGGGRPKPESYDRADALVVALATAVDHAARVLRIDRASRLAFLEAHGALTVSAAELPPADTRAFLGGGAGGEALAESFEHHTGLAARALCVEAWGFRDPHAARQAPPTPVVPCGPGGVVRDIGEDIVGNLVGNMVVDGVVSVGKGVIGSIMD